MGGIPNYARSGTDALLAQGLDDLGARVDLIAAQAPGGAAAFMVLDFTDPNTPRPPATVVMWRGPAVPVNVGPNDYFVPA